ncbi:MAG: N-acetyltransferase [Rhodospirillaceae bacterium]|nr:N-acetyltransferase [Rhodospirillaceae bacterium]
MKMLHTAAFPTPAEATLVEQLHLGGHVPVSLVAEQDHKIIGHVVFSRLHVEVDGRFVSALALAPVSVDPRAQNLGVGASLIKAGHAKAQAEGWEVAIVLGEPNYYNRFGYDSGLVEHLDSPYAGEYLMGLEFVHGALAGHNGAMVYAPPFNNLG